MIADSRTFGLIPARGGSKGIPRKNIKLLGGKPLIAWTIEAALRCESLDAVVVSTDDEEIADVARRFGAQVPFLRPPELSRDESPGIDPVLHALEQMPAFDAVMLLQPTSPLRTAADIDACAALARGLGAPAAVSVCEPLKHPYWMYRMDADHHLTTLIETQAGRRQDLPAVYALNGAVYFANAAWLRRHRSFIAPETVGYVMPSERSVDVDTHLDWALAELLLTKHG